MSCEHCECACVDCGKCGFPAANCSQEQASQPPEAQVPIIRCRDCGGTQPWEKTAEGYEVIHSCHAGKQVREMVNEAFQRGEQSMAEKAARILEQLPAAQNPYHASNGVREAIAELRSLAGAATTASTQPQQVQP